MAATTGSTDTGSGRERGPQTLREWAVTLAPRLEVVSASVPEPTLEPGDTLAIFADADAARELVLHWERIQPDDDSVGFVALGADPGGRNEIDRPTGADPEGVGAHTLKQVLKGGVPGAVIGAVVVAAITAIISGGDGTVIGAAFGGGAFGAVAGAVMAVVKGTGWSEAYQHSFVDPTATALAVASFHSTEHARREDALAAARAAAGARLARVDEHGRVVPLDGSLRPDDGG